MKPEKKWPSNQNQVISLIAEPVCILKKNRPFVPVDITKELSSSMACIGHAANVEVA